MYDYHDRIMVNELGRAYNITCAGNSEVVQNSVRPINKTFAEMGEWGYQNGR